MTGDQLDGTDERAGLDELGAVDGDAGTVRLPDQSDQIGRQVDRSRRAGLRHLILANLMTSREVKKSTTKDLVRAFLSLALGVGLGFVFESTLTGWLSLLTLASLAGGGFFFFWFGMHGSKRTRELNRLSNEFGQAVYDELDYDDEASFIDPGCGHWSKMGDGDERPCMVCLAVSDAGPIEVREPQGGF